jgi:hypothetical protein
MSGSAPLVLNNLLPRNIARIAELWTFRHFAYRSLLFSSLYFFAFSLVIRGQAKVQNVELRGDDIANTIEAFKTADIRKTVAEFKAKMPYPVTDPKTRAEIFKDLPASVVQLRVSDNSLEQKLRQLLKPVLGLYGREQSYALVIIQHSTPLIFSDSGVVLVITTGALIEVENEDELIGLIAHEVGHEYFAQHSIYARYLLEKIVDKKEIALVRHLSEVLSLLELQCDAFAAISTAYLGYDPFAFRNWLERVAKKFPDHSKGLHPKESVRREIVVGVLQPGYSGVMARKTSAVFAELKAGLKKDRK